MSVNSKMTAIADEIRELSGTTEAMGLDAMASNVSEVNAEVNSQTELLTQAVLALNGKTSGGGGTTGLSVQADWNQTDEMAPDFIKNKPESLGGGASHWNELEGKPFVTVGSDILVWDGNTEGLEYTTGTDGLVAYHISNAVPTYEVITTSGFNVELSDGQSSTMSGSEVSMITDISGFFGMPGAGMFYVIPYDGYTMEYTNDDTAHSMTFPKAGIWIEKPEVYFTAITIPGYTGFGKEQIKEKYIPDTISRTDHGHKWNDISDRPFGDEVVELGETATFDGDLTDKVVAHAGIFVYVRIADSTPTYEELLNGFAVTFNRNDILGIPDTTVSADDAASNIQQGEGGIVILDGLIFIAFQADELFPTAGVYVLGEFWISDESENTYITSFTVNGYNFKKTVVNKLPEKYYLHSWGDLADKPFGINQYLGTARAATVSETEGDEETYGHTLVWDGDTNGLFSFEASGFTSAAYKPLNNTWYRVSSFVPSQAEIDAGTTGVNVDGADTDTSKVHQTGYITTLGSGCLIAQADDCGLSADSGKISIPKAGIYFAAGTKSIIITGFHFPEFGGTKLDEKYIPDTIQRVGDDVILNSSTAGSTKKFKLTVDDSGTITATEVT